MYGAIVIDPRNDVENPFNMVSQDENELRALRKAEQETEPLLIADWRPLTSEELWQIEEISGVESYCASAVLINGKGSSYCLPQDRLNALMTDVQRAISEGQALTDLGLVVMLLQVSSGVEDNMLMFY